MINFFVKLHVQNIIMKNTATLPGDMAAWEAEAENPGSEEIATVSHVHYTKADRFGFNVGLVPQKQNFARLDVFSYVIRNMYKFGVLRLWYTFAVPMKAHL